ncbi:MAG TPA: Crp/Fnr family transcriptional regulator [Thermoanaerobaculia bacterium]|nr:Crp/Fnr family transcriptional regulator [Thermoanaerobaculia bacterium]
MTQPELSRNLLLAALPTDALRHLEGAFRISERMVDDDLFSADDQTELYFPLDGVISLLRSLENGAEVEVGMVGAEGFAGINALLGVQGSPHHGLVQGRGWLARIDPAAMRAEMQRDQRVADVLLRFVHAFMANTSQLAACNRVHLLEERLAHWLLLLADRVGAPEMSVTQEFLARMLGARRAGINEGIRALREAGCIEHGRNRIRIIDRAALEERSCECYDMMFAEYERALGFAPVNMGRVADVD